MKFFGFGRAAGLVLFVFAVFLASDTAMAGGGSWGSQGGSWGSQGGSWGSQGGSWGSQGGSWGSRGGSQGGSLGSSGGTTRARWTPFRNLLGRHRMRRSGGSNGYYTGGSTGYASGGSSGGISYSSLGSTGSRSYGSSGGSWGTSYASSSSGVGYGNWGATYLNQPSMNSGYYDAPVILDSGAMGIPLESSPGMNSFGTPSGVSPGTVIPGNGVPKSIIERDGVVPGRGGEDPNRLETAPSPGPTLAPPGESGEIVLVNPIHAVLSVKLPREAQLRINGRLTTTEGDFRSFISRRLKSGNSYDFRVQAILSRNGKEIVRNQNVKLANGLQKTISFDFDQPAVTTLAVKVPSDATVVLSGKPTSASGRSVRYFRTQALNDGESWKDYKIQVSVVRNGKTVTREETIDISAGEVRLVAFDFGSAGQVVQK